MKVLCIGGPLNGRVVDGDRYGSTFRHVPQSAPSLFGQAMRMRSDDINTGEAVEYTLRQISHKGDDRPPILFYTAEGVDTYAAIVRVFTAYTKDTP